MTEEEAKTKWCPMVRFNTETKNFNAFNNREEMLLNAAGDYCKCIASDCMMWRVLTNNQPYAFEPSVDGSILCTNGPQVIGGYCGLAGKL